MNITANLCQYHDEYSSLPHTKILNIETSIYSANDIERIPECPYAETIIFHWPVSSIPSLQKFQSFQNIILPPSISILPPEIFANRENISVILPQNLEEIPQRAFASSGLTSIVIPDSVTWICKEAFSECHYLSSITIPKSLIWIEEKAFFRCDSLASINLP